MTDAPSTREPPSRHPAHDAAPALARNLSALGLVGLGVGGTIGAGIFVLTGTTAAQYAGPGLVLSFVIAGVAAGLVGLCYAELAAMMPAAGSTYTYAYASLGPFAAWLIGWDLVLEFAVAAATVAVGWSGYARSALAGFGVHLPSASEAGGVDWPAAGIVLALTVLLMRDNREASGANVLLVLLKVAIVLAFVGLGAPHVRPELWSPLVPPNEGAFGSFGWSGILRGAGVVFFAFIGFETVSCAAGEARDPGRDAPRGLIGALLVSAVLYVAVAAVLTGLVPYRALDVPDPIAKAVDAAGLGVLAAWIKLGALLGLTTACLSALYGQGRVLYAMARDHMVPAAFARLHPRSRAPRLCQAATGLATAGVAALAPIDMLGELVSIGTLAAFVLVCAIVLILRRRAPDHPRPFRVPGGAWVPVAGIFACLALMAGLPGGTWARLGGWLALGLALWFAAVRRRVGAAPGLDRAADQ